MHLFSILMACSGGGGSDDGPIPSDYTSTTGPNHCDAVEGDEIWAADLNPHVVDCSLYFEGRSLTIGPGTIVQVANDVALYFSYYGEASGLLVDGTDDYPVEIGSGASNERGAWSGILVYEAADDANMAIKNTVISEAGGYGAYGALSVDGADILVKNLTVQRSEEAGFYLANGARFAEGSAGLVVVDSDQAGAMAADNADSLPDEGAELTDNDDARVWIGGATVTESATWGSPGVSYVVSGNTYLEGIAGQPAVLTLEAGVEIQAANDIALYLSYYGGSSGLWAKGTTESPVVFTSADSRNPGAWGGILAYGDTDDASFSLANTEIHFGGGYGSYANLYCSGTNPTIVGLLTTNSEEAGFYLDDGARFTDASSALAAQDNAYAGAIGADSADSVPEDGASISGNDVNGVIVTGGTLTESATWGNVGVPYLAETLYVEGDAGSTAVLTIDAGVTVAFFADSSLYLGYYGGSAALRVQGTESEGVTFTAAESPEAGEWGGILMYDAVDDDQTVLEHFTIEYGGGYGSYANLSFDDASPTIRNAQVQHSEEYGIYTDGDAAPILDNVTYSDNAAGNRN